MEVVVHLGAKHPLKLNLCPPSDAERCVLASLIAFQREGSGSWERPFLGCKTDQKLLKTFKYQKDREELCSYKFSKTNPIDKRVSQVDVLLLSP